MLYEGRGRRGGRDFESRRFPPKPVEVGKEYDVEILETSRRGEGIARIKGLVCFVSNAKPGEHVRIKITRVSRRFAEAELVGEATGEETEAAVESEESEETEGGEDQEAAEEEDETE
jgi:predicted RNA-binding protein with TRAM domain